mgnify:CR=1 FL=1
MSEKIDKLRASLEKEKERRIKINNRIESLERRIQEAEAAEVNEMVRTAKVTPEQLAALLRQSATSTPNPAALSAVGATIDKEERKQAEEDAKKAAKEAAASGSEQTGGNKVTKYAATFLGVLALVGLVAGGGIYTFMKQKQKKQAEKEALDPDANYTEDKGDFEIPTEDEPEETGEEDTEPI